MSSVLDLARPELRGIRPYVPGAYEPGCIRLNANESPWRTPGDTSERERRRMQREPGEILGPGREARLAGARTELEQPRLDARPR